MRLLSSLRSRIFLTSALLAVLSIGVAIYIVNVNVTAEAENALQDEITATGRLVKQLQTRSADTYTTTAKLIANGPTLKSAVYTNDPPTVQDVVAKDYQTQVKSSLLLVTGRGGNVLATVGAEPRAASVVASQPSVRDALAGHESFSLLPWENGILELVTVPISIGLKDPVEILGTLSVGFLLDDAFADQLKAMTGSEVAFGVDGQILATTLPREDRPALAELLRRAERAPNVTLGTERAEEYGALPLPLSSVSDSGIPGAGPVALILRSRAGTQRFLQSIHTQLLVTAAVAVLLTFLVSFAVARTITQPLAAITDAMREVASTGDLTRKIVFRGNQRWNDEDARLLATTFNTLTDSIARFQVEMSQKERLSSLGRLSTVIAHEVRNPLMIIKAALHGLRQPGLTPAALGEAAADGSTDGIARLNRDRERGARLRASDPELRARSHRPERALPRIGRGGPGGARSRGGARPRRDAAESDNGRRAASRCPCEPHHERAARGGGPAGPGRGGFDARERHPRGYHRRGLRRRDRRR